MRPDPDSLRAYVVTRRDLPTMQRGVQAAHALAELTYQAAPGNRHFRSWVEDHKTLLILAVKNEEELEAFQAWAESSGILHRSFFEPDIGNQRTAVALWPMKYKDVPEEILRLPLA
jgi:peptidyl-tRNA hydrolase